MRVYPIRSVAAIAAVFVPLGSLAARPAQAADNAPKPTYLGHYDDQFIRENGRWKFLRPQSVSDISPLRP